MKYFYLFIFSFFFFFSCQSGQEEYISSKNQPPSDFEVNHILIKEKLVTLSWTKATDPDDDKVTYSIYNEEKLVAEELTATYYTFSGLKTGTQYTGTIVASDGNGGISEVAYEFTTQGKPDEVDDTDDSQESLKVPEYLKSYYRKVNFSLRNEELREQLAEITIGKHMNFYEYGEHHRFLYKASADLENKDKVLLIYSGEKVFWKAYDGNSYGQNAIFNTEHVYPKSNLVGSAANDLHNFAPCIIKINSNRGNMPFTDGSGRYAKTGNGWYPGDDWRGDVARIIFYMNLRYDESFDDISTEGIDLLLKWNAEDKVSAWEIQRNAIFEEAQGNRNPFIDNPYLATLIWKGKKAENLWR